jgi:hypothetical protein
MAVRSCRRAASSFVTVILALSVMGKPKEPELHPDAWARFERAVHVVAKSPPQHRKKPSKKQKARVKRNEEKIR